MTNAFPEGAKQLSNVVRNAKIDVAALSRPLKPCDLSVCHGTCCHDGVYLSGEEAEVVRKLAVSEKESFRQMGIELPAQVVVYGKCGDIASGPKTATRSSPMKQRVADYPSHFEETNCVFLLADARCALQALAVNQGIDHWFYKPVVCWMHPLSFAKNSDGEDLLTLYNETNDPNLLPGYDGFASKTHCGRICNEPGGRPAYEVLAGELKRLGEIGNRDLLKEINEQVRSECVSSQEGEI